MTGLHLRVVLLLVLLGPLGRWGSAQVFEPGYLILSRGDTLRGEVENEFWSSPPKVVRFRSTAPAPIRTYRASQLRAVQLTSGRLLRRELLPIDYSASTNAAQLEYGLIIRQQFDSLLADVLVEGQASLLRVEWGQVQHFFVRREQRPYLEMTERRYLDNSSHNGVSLRDGNNYRGQLNIYFGDCAPAVAVADRAQFTAADLIEVVQTYNEQCSASRQPGHRIAADKSAAGRIKFQVGPLLGVRYTSMKVRTQETPGAETQTLNGRQLGGAPSPQPGLYFDILDGGRRAAVHTALFGYRVGQVTPLPSPDGTPQWAGTLDWRALVATLQLGLRGMQPVGRNYTLLAGTGLEITRFWVQGNTMRYGSGSTTRGTADLLRSTSQTFDLGFGPSKLPYLELGVRRQRLTVLLTGRMYSRQEFYDFLTVGPIVTNPNGTRSSTGYTYSARTISTALVVSYQINPDSDLRRVTR